MKKKTVIILLSVLIVFSALFYACNSPSGEEQSESSIPHTEEDNDKISELEAMIQAILKDHQVSEAEKNKHRAFKFFDKLITVHANLIWNPASNVELGFEYLHIHKFKAKFTKLTEVPSRNACTNRLLASLKITF